MSDSKLKELIEKIKKNSESCDSHCVDLRALTFESKDGENFLKGEDVAYYFKTDPQAPKDPRVVHGAKQFCKMIKIPYSFFAKNPEYMKKHMVECWLPTMKPEKSMVLVKTRPSGDNSHVIRAVLPVEYTNVSNSELLDQISLAAGQEFVVDLAVGEARDDLVMHLRLLSSETFNAYGETCCLGFLVTASELGACTLKVDTMIYRTESKSAMLASYANESFFECSYEKILPEDLMGLFPQVLSHLKGTLPDIKNRIQSAKELDQSTGDMNSNELLKELRLKRGLNEKFHLKLMQEIYDNPVKNLWDFANRMSIIAKDFDIPARVKIERAAGDMIGLNFVKE